MAVGGCHGLGPPQDRGGDAGALGLPWTAENSVNLSHLETEELILSHPQPFPGHPSSSFRQKLQARMFMETEDEAERLGLPNSRRSLVGSGEWWSKNRDLGH